MWSCNSSASPAVCPDRRVLPVVTPWAAADEMGRTFSGLVLGGAPQGRHALAASGVTAGRPPSRRDPASAGDVEDRGRLVDVRGR